MKYLLSNWKMYPTITGAVALFAEIQRGLRQRAADGRPMPLPILCPPFVSLALIRAFADHDIVRLGAQDCHWETDGPHTGEISAAMLKEVVDYVIVGHSERRLAGETEEQVAAKVQAAADAGLTPILCVGEDERTSSATSQSEKRLVSGLSRIDPPRDRVLVVYEPVWAVGADRAADVGYVSEVVEHLKDRMQRLGIPHPEVIYGGTVTAENVRKFAGIASLDGVGATRSCLEASDFLALFDQLVPKAKLAGS